MTPLQQLAHDTTHRIFHSTPQRPNMEQEFAEMEAVILKALEEAQAIAIKHPAELMTEKQLLSYFQNETY